MRIDKLTSKLQSALADAQSLALGKDNNQIEPCHLMLALVDQKGGSVTPLLSQTGFNVTELRGSLQQLVDNLPEVQIAKGKYLFLLSLENYSIRLTSLPRRRAILLSPVKLFC